MSQKIMGSKSSSTLKKNQICLNLKNLFQKNLIIKFQKIIKNYLIGALKTYKNFGVQFGTIQMLKVKKLINLNIQKIL